MKIADFKIEEWMNKYEASATYDLTTTCIAPLSINELDYDKSIFDVKLGYGDITGSVRLKTAIKSLYENPFRTKYFSVASTDFPSRRHFSIARSKSCC